MPHAISGIYNSNGQKGHDATFTGLGKVIRRFALPREMAEEAIGDWNSRCEPPWSDEELAHKLDSIYADGHDADDWGKFLDDDYDDDPEELRPWVNSKDLGTIIRIYLGTYLDTGEPKAVAEDFETLQTIPRRQSGATGAEGSKAVVQSNSASTPTGSLVA